MTHQAQQIKERPILFSGPMVRAILEGRKTQTRRALKGAALSIADCGAPVDLDFCPYGQPGDRLWVRETWGVGTRAHHVHGWLDGFEYRADELIIDSGDDLPIYPHSNFDFSKYYSGKWRPSIHMPRAASRILLEVTDVRVERLREISKTDAMSEGVDYKDCPLEQTIEDFRHNANRTTMTARLSIDYVAGFQSLWQSINGPESWNENPWVWVVEFKRIDP